MGGIDGGGVDLVHPRLELGIDRGAFMIRD